MQEKFHADRERNLASFFKDHHGGGGGAGVDDNEKYNPMLRDSQHDQDDNNHEHEHHFIPPSKYHNEDHESDEDEEDDAYAQGRDHFSDDFGDSPYSDTTQTPLKNPFGSFDKTNWDSFFNGHEDTVDKDINTLAKHHLDEHDGYTEDGPIDESGDVHDHEEPRGRHNQHPDTQYDDQDEDYNDHGSEGEDYHDSPDHRLNSYLDYDQNLEDHDNAGGGGTASGNDETGERGRDYPDYDNGNRHRPHYDSYDDDYDTDGPVDYDSTSGSGREEQDMPREKSDPFGSDAVLNGYFDYSSFDDFFKKLENGVDNEIPGENPHNHYDPDGPESRARNPQYDRVTYEDLRPDSFDNQHPDMIGFRMPSHEDLQRNYKTVSTSASEIVEHVVKFDSDESDDPDFDPLKVLREKSMRSKQRNSKIGRPYNKSKWESIGSNKHRRDVK